MLTWMKLLLYSSLYGGQWHTGEIDAHNIRLLFYVLCIILTEKKDANANAVPGTRYQGTHNTVVIVIVDSRYLCSSTTVSLVSLIVK